MTGSSLSLNILSVTLNTGELTPVSFYISVCHPNTVICDISLGDPQLIQPGWVSSLNTNLTDLVMCWPCRQIYLVTAGSNPRLPSYASVCYTSFPFPLYDITVWQHIVETSEHVISQSYASQCLTIRVWRTFQCSASMCCYITVCHQSDLDIRTCEITVMRHHSVETSEPMSSQRRDITVLRHQTVWLTELWHNAILWKAIEDKTVGNPPRRICLNKT